MPSATQTLTISTAFPNQKVDPEKFRNEIHADATMVTIVRTVSTQGDTCTVEFAADISTAEQDRLPVLAAAHDGEPALVEETVALSPSLLDTEGRLRSVSEGIVGSEKYLYVHNLCDPCAWYQNAVQRTNIALSNTVGDQQTYGNGFTHWIDLKHGRVFREDDIAAGGAYYPVVEVSDDGGLTWAEVTENSWGTKDGDYDVDYEAGKVIFNARLDPATQVRGSFWNAASSSFTIKPAPGKRLKLSYVEVQFTTDVKPTGAVYFDIYLYAAAVVQMLLSSADPANQAAGAQLQAAIDAGVLQPTDPYLAKRETYKKIIDFYQESTGPFPTVPQIGSGSERGLNQPLATIPFNYLAVRDLRSSQGAEIRVSLQGDRPFDGEFANATFYCLSENE